MVGITRIRFSFTQTVRLNRLVYDNQKPANLIVHHGLLGSLKNFRNICKNKVISDRFNCHLIDSRNHGDSPHTVSHNIQQLAQDLKNYIIQNKLENVTLMGHSMGGQAVMSFTNCFPQMQSTVKRVIVLDMRSQSVQMNPEIKEMLDNLCTIDMERSSVEQVFELLNKYGKTPDMIGLLKMNIEIKDDRVIWKANIPVLSKYYPTSIANFAIDRVTPWQNPVEVIYGEKSNYVDEVQARRFWQIYRNFSQSNLYRIEKAGHWVHFDQPTKFLQALDDIFQKQ